MTVGGQGWAEPPGLPRGQAGTLTSEPPPRGATAGQLDHTRGEHEAKQQPAHEPEGEGFMGQGPGQPTLRGLLMVGGLPQGGHQHSQEASLQQQGIPKGRRKSTKGPPIKAAPPEGPPRADKHILPHPQSPEAPPPKVTHHWK